MKKQTRRIYEELRSGVERQGGKMTYVPSGTSHGAWIIEHHGKIRQFESNGAGFPELDKLYVPKTAAPAHSKDYTNELIDGAIAKLLGMLK